MSQQSGQSPIRPNGGQSPRKQTATPETEQLSASSPSGSTFHQPVQLLSIPIDQPVPSTSSHSVRSSQAPGASGTSGDTLPSPESGFERLLNRLREMRNAFPNIDVRPRTRFFGRTPITPRPIGPFFTVPADKSPSVATPKPARQKKFFESPGRLAAVVKGDTPLRRRLLPSYDARTPPVKEEIPSEEMWRSDLPYIPTPDKWTPPPRTPGSGKILSWRDFARRERSPLDLDDTVSSREQDPTIFFEEPTSLSASSISENVESYLQTQKKREILNQTTPAKSDLSQEFPRSMVPDVVRSAGNVARTSEGQPKYIPSSQAGVSDGDTRVDLCASKVQPLETVKRSPRSSSTSNTGMLNTTFIQQRSSPFSSDPNETFDLDHAQTPRENLNAFLVRQQSLSPRRELNTTVTLQHQSPPQTRNLNATLTAQKSPTQRRDLNTTMTIQQSPPSRRDFKISNKILPKLIPAMTSTPESEGIDGRAVQGSLPQVQTQSSSTTSSSVSLELGSSEDEAVIGIRTPFDEILTLYGDTPTGDTAIQKLHKITKRTLFSEWTREKVKGFLERKRKDVCPVEHKKDPDLSGITRLSISTVKSSVSADEFLKEMELLEEPETCKDLPEPELSTAVKSLGRAEAITHLREAVAVAEIAASTAPPQLAEEAAAAAARDYQMRLIDEFTEAVKEKAAPNEIPKTVTVVGYIGITRPK